jgi:hypothetical protein
MKIQCTFISALALLGSVTEQLACCRLRSPFALFVACQKYIILEKKYIFPK